LQPADPRSLFADPLYRYEARRYWNWRRYLGTVVALAAWWPVVIGYFLFGPYGVREGEDVVAAVCWFSIVGRAPLNYLAATAGALAIVPEKVSGQLEQFILTPVDPWRFCLARMAGRLRGLFFFWGLYALGFALAWPIITASVVRGAGAGTYSTVMTVVVASMVDLAAMLVVDAAVGMRFTSTSSRTSAALVKTYLTSFLLLPLAMFVWAAAGMAVGALIADRFLDLYGEARFAAGIVAAVVFRLGLGAIAVRLALRDARRAVGATFYRPEAP
jgi:hypothetical protein